MGKYVIGIDFGTLSGRTVIVDTATGQVLASAVYEYPHAVMDQTMPDGTPLPDGWALQHPRDYLEVLDTTIPHALNESGISAQDVVAIGVDFTTSTLLPTLRDGTPLCFLDEYENNPHAYVKLWKHHGAQEQANRMTEVARQRKEPWLDSCGGKIFSEWALPKLWELLERAPDIYEAMDAFVEAGDWIVWQLCGKWVHNACVAGIKSLYRTATGFPSEDYMAALDPRLRHAITDKIWAPVAPIFSRAGSLTPAMADRLGLQAGITVAVSIGDAHACGPASGITQPGQMLAIIGTSSCYLTLSKELQLIPGISGAAEDCVLPGYWGYEAGQTCVGDLFAWAAKTLMTESYAEKAHALGMSDQQYLTELAKIQRPGAHGLVALDWWNGNRSILMDSDLTGLLVGMTLNTRPEDIYRAMIEATAFGARTVVENYAAHDVQVSELFVTGGICKKNPMLMQIYADVLKLPMRVVSTTQGGALGSAIIAATAAGIYPTAVDAIKAMASPCDTVYTPIPENTAIYDRLYGIYRQLHDAFGKEGKALMCQLNRLKADNK